MSTRGRRLCAPAALAVVTGFASVAASADSTKSQCIDANGQGQQLRRDGKLTDAREKLRQCAAPTCPAMVRDDCIKRLDDLDRAQPTIAFAVKDASGADVSAVKVTMDGKPFAEKLDGTALPADIGEHTFLFERMGQPAVSRTLVLTEGEKGRRERVAIGPAMASSPAPRPAPAAVVDESSPRSSQAADPAAPATDASITGGRMGTRKVVGLVAGGLGFVGIGVGGIFGWMTLAQKSQQESDCGAPGCSSASRAKALDDHSSATRDGTIATVGFAAGAALLLGGAVLYLTGGHADATATTRLLVRPSVGPSGGGMLVRGEF